MSEGGKGKKRRDYAAIIGFLAGYIILCIVFYKSQITGGATWDEGVDLKGTGQQLSVAGRWLAGDPAAHFSQVELNWAFYGIAGTLPAYVVRAYAAEAEAVGRYMLHVTAFTCYLIALVLSYLILIRTTGKRGPAAVGTALLALYPLWLGQSFFDYKDVPTAAFALLALYAAIGILQAARLEIVKYCALLVLASVLIAGMKIAALALIIPAWGASCYGLVRGRHFGALAGTAIAAAAGILLITPVAWSDPIHFMVRAVAEMARHPWNGCTPTAGACVFTDSPEWSVARYLISWFAVQTPLLIGAGALAAIALSWRNAVSFTIALSAALPLLLIVAGNATLYNGLRQIIFEIPLLFILAAMFWNDIAERAGSTIIRLFAAVLALLFIWDDFAMFPYNFIYFNLPARQIANETNFTTDYWGFSLKEAAVLPVVLETPSPLIIGYPSHLVEPFIEKERTVADFKKPEELPNGAEAVIVAFVRYPTPPSWCEEPQYVTRQLPLGGQILKLSYAARCVTP